MREHKPLQALADHIDKTHGDYYGGDKQQPLDWAIAQGISEEYCRCNIHKYNHRINAKHADAEGQYLDALKCAHYAVLLVGEKLKKLEAVKSENQNGESA